MTLERAMMNTTCLLIIFGLATVYFGALTFKLLPTLIRLLAAILTGAVKWPGPRIHDPDLSASTIRERLGVGYQNLFPTFIENSLSVVAGFFLSLFTFIVNTPLLIGYIAVKSMWLLMILTGVAFISARMTFKKARGNRIRVSTLLSELGKKGEPRAVDWQSAESEYGIEHPLVGHQAPGSAKTRALDLYYESVRSHQDGNERRALDLYQEAISSDPSLHEHARDTLSGMVQNCTVKDASAIYYWLGIHSENLSDWNQAAAWYEKAIESFHQLKYPKRESRAHCNLGNVKMHLMDDSAMDEFEKAIVLNPTNGTAHINIGTAYYGISEPGDIRHERALEAFADAIMADPAVYGPIVISRLRTIGYTWKEDMEKIGQRVAKKQGMDLDDLAAGELEATMQANDYFQIGNGFFQSGRCKEALEQFEKGKLVMNKFPGNFFGVSMVAMHMIEIGAIPKDQIPFYLEKAKQNIDQCLLIAPTNPDYQRTKIIIGEYENKYRVI
jgi:tetratricopeptide (TPR) repeat protein